MQYMHEWACEVHSSACDVTGWCMQLPNGLCFDFVSDIPLLQLLWCKINRWLIIYMWHYYCIWGISETTGASSDVYCQSNNDNHIQTSCTFYVESIQVKHSGELGREHRERENEILQIGERGRENIMGFKSGTIILVLTNGPKST
jgi:hypothetical protein